MIFLPLNSSQLTGCQFSLQKLPRAGTGPWAESSTGMRNGRGYTRATTNLNVYHNHVGKCCFEMAMESEDRVSDAVRVIERGGHPHHEAMAAVMARILASATPPGPGSASKIQESKRKGGGKRIEQNIKRKRRKMKVVKVAISLVLFSNLCRCHLLSFLVKGRWSQA